MGVNVLAADVSGISILASPAAGEGELVDASGRQMGGRPRSPGWRSDPHVKAKERVECCEACARCWGSR